jgi:hypothetical protein
VRRDDGRQQQAATSLPPRRRSLAAAAAAALTLGLAAALPLGPAWAADVPAPACVAAAAETAFLPAGFSATVVVGDGAGGLLATDGSSVLHAEDGCGWSPVFALPVDATGLGAGAEVRALTATRGLATAHLLLGDDEMVMVAGRRGESWDVRSATPACETPCDLLSDDAGLLLRSGDQLLRSADGGATWLAVPLPDGTLQAATVDADGVLWVAGASALLRSADGGATFEVLEVLEAPVRALAVLDGTVLALTDDGLRRLHPAGGPALDGVLPDGDVTRLVVTGGRLLVATPDGLQPIGVPATDDEPLLPAEPIVADHEVPTVEVVVEAQPVAVADLPADDLLLDEAVEIPTPADLAEEAVDLALPGETVVVVADSTPDLLAALPSGEAILIGARPVDEAGAEGESVEIDNAEEAEPAPPVEDPAPRPEPVEEAVAPAPARPLPAPGPVEEVAAGAITVTDAPHAATMPTAAQVTAGLAGAALLGLVALSLLPRLSPVAARALGLESRRRR